MITKPTAAFTARAPLTTAAAAGEIQLALSVRIPPWSHATPVEMVQCVILQFNKPVCFFPCYFQPMVKRKTKKNTSLSVGTLIVFGRGYSKRGRINRGTYKQILKAPICFYVPQTYI